jgi:transcriptional regulator with XRE-family HTH domain
MLKLETINRVQRLLATGQYSQRAIARMAGIGRALVSRIARGLLDERLASAETDDSDFEFVEPERPYVRCPTCGGRVLMPCLLCQFQAREERERRRARLQQWLATPDGQRQILDPIAARRQSVSWPRRYVAAAVDTKTDAIANSFTATDFTARDLTESRGDFPGQRDDESPRQFPRPDPRQPAPGCSAREPG